MKRVRAKTFRVELPVIRTVHLSVMPITAMINRKLQPQALRISKVQIVFAVFCQPLHYGGYGCQDSSQRLQLCLAPDTRHPKPDTQGTIDSGHPCYVYYNFSNQMIEQLLFDRDAKRKGLMAPDRIVVALR